MHPAVEEAKVKARTLGCSDKDTASGGSITISLGIDMATSSRIVVVLTSNAGTAGVSGDLLLSTGTLSVGNSGALDIGCGTTRSSTRQ